MIANLLTLLKFEQQLLIEMVSLAERQQKALIGFNTSELEKITMFQIEVSGHLRQTEEKRIKLLISNYNLKRIDAVNLSLSDIINKLDKVEKTEFAKLRKELRELINKLHNFNIVNRVLANRARTSVREIMGYFTNGTNQVCNVRI